MPISITIFIYFSDCSVPGYGRHTGRVRSKSSRITACVDVVWQTDRLCGDARISSPMRAFRKFSQQIVDASLVRLCVSRLLHVRVCVYVSDSNIKHRYMRQVHTRIEFCEDECVFCWCKMFLGSALEMAHSHTHTHAQPHANKPALHIYIHLSLYDSIPYHNIILGSCKRIAGT